MRLRRPNVLSATGNQPAGRFPLKHASYEIETARPREAETAHAARSADMEESPLNSDRHLTRFEADYLTVAANDLVIVVVTDVVTVECRGQVARPYRHDARVRRQQPIQLGQALALDGHPFLAEREQPFDQSRTFGRRVQPIHLREEVIGVRNRVVQWCYGESSRLLDLEPRKLELVIPVQHVYPQRGLGMWKRL